MLPPLINPETATSDERAQFIRHARNAIRPTDQGGLGETPTIELQRCVIACLQSERGANMTAKPRATTARTVTALSDDDI